MDPGTILAVVSLIGQVIGSVDKVISVFDSLQNAPRELREFRISARRLQRHFAAFQADMQANGGQHTLLHEDDVQEIEETLILCSQLFSEYDAGLQQSQGIVGGVLRATWTMQSGRKLARYKARIDNHYQQILLPTWIASMSATRTAAQQAGSSATAGSSSSQAAVVEPSSVTSVVPSYELEHLSQGVKVLGRTDNIDVTEQTLHDLELTLQRCWSRIGLDVGDLFESAGLTVGGGRRQSMIPYQEAPTTLTLENAPEQHRKLKLQRVHIMAKGDQSRILQYQNKNASIHVTHIIPYGSIPWTPDKNSKRVSFLTQHVITVVDSDGYHLYHIDPKYRFQDADTCRRFQSTLRERDLLNAFMGVEVSQPPGAVVISRRQVIRFWRRAPATVTMTFLESSVGDGRRHTELDLDQFRADAEFYLPWNARRLVGMAKKAEASDALDVLSTKEPHKSLRIKFETVQEAVEFKSVFKAIHPSSAPPPQVELAFSSASATPAPTPSDSTWSTGPPPSVASTFSLDADPDDYWGAVLGIPGSKGSAVAEM